MPDTARTVLLADGKIIATNLWADHEPGGKVRITLDARATTARMIAETPPLRVTLAVLGDGDQYTEWLFEESEISKGSPEDIERGYADSDIVVKARFVAAATYFDRHIRFLNAVWEQQKADAHGA